MSVLELEDPVTTLLRLISSRIRVIKDNGDTAKILATEQAFDRELLLKQYDAQITLAVEPNLGVQDQKIDLSGRLRRQIYFFKCTAHAIDKPTLPGSDLGRVMRSKITQQIKAIMRENRTLPYQTIYNFSGLGYPTGEPHKAFMEGADSELSPSSELWREFGPTDYQLIWSKDGTRLGMSDAISGEYAMMLFCFKVGAREQCVKKLELSFTGHGTAPAGNGVTIKVWNHATAAWQQTQTGTAATDETLTINLLASWPDFIDSNGYVWLLARTTNPTDGATPAVLSCDFVQLTMQVYGITHCDLVSYKPIDVVDVKPFLFKEEFVLKAYAFETISG